MGFGFREKLTRRQISAQTLVCVGLDPLEEKLPEEYMLLARKNGLAAAVLAWMIGVVNKTADCACMFKSQRAHWEAIEGGIEALRSVIRYIHSKYPDIPVFLDCKRGDIDRTQTQYREAHFTIDGADGMNYNGYMGKGTLKSLVDSNHLGRALVGLGRTSNPDAWEVQDRILQDGRMVWEAMVDDIYKWSDEFGILGNAGIVMGAAHPDPNVKDGIYYKHLREARRIVGNDMWFLIPGIGTQGGLVRETVRAAYDGPGSIVISSSSKIIFSDDPAREAKALRDEITLAIESFSV